MTTIVEAPQRWIRVDDRHHRYLDVVLTFGRCCLPINTAKRLKFGAGSTIVICDVEKADPKEGVIP